MKKVVSSNLLLFFDNKYIELLFIDNNLNQIIIWNAYFFYIFSKLKSQIR